MTLLTHEAVVPRWLSVEPTVCIDIVSEEFLETQPEAHLGDQWKKTSSVLSHDNVLGLLRGFGQAGKSRPMNQMSLTQSLGTRLAS